MEFHEALFPQFEKIKILHEKHSEKAKKLVGPFFMILSWQFVNDLATLRVHNLLHGQNKRIVGEASYMVRLHSNPTM